MNLHVIDSGNVYDNMPSVTSLTRKLHSNHPSNMINNTHTGYGFLSESAPFAQSLVNNNITWVGPPPDVLNLFGDKIQARALAKQSNVPVVRGSGNMSSGDECLSVLREGDVRLPAIMKV